MGLWWDEYHCCVSAWKFNMIHWKYPHISIPFIKLGLCIVLHYQQWSTHESNELILWKLGFTQWKYWMTLHATWIQLKLNSIVLHYQQWSTHESNELILWKLGFTQWKYWMTLHATWIQLKLNSIQFRIKLIEFKF
jgi:hypothetical protein